MACVDDLPDGLLLAVFERLAVADVAACASACARWSRVCNDNLLWKRLFSRDFSVEPVGRDTRWRNEYRRLRHCVPSVLVQTLDDHTDEVLYLAFSHLGDRMVSCSKDCTFKVWDCSDGRLALASSYDMKQHGWDMVWCVCSEYSPDDRLLMIWATVNHGAMVTAIFDASPADGMYTLLRRLSRDIVGCWVSDKHLLTGSMDGYEKATMWLEAPGEDGREVLAVQDSRIIRFAKVRPSGCDDLLAAFTFGAGAFVPHRLGFHRIRTTEPAKVPVLEKEVDMGGEIVGYALSPDGRYVFVNVRRWAEDGAEPTLDEVPEIVQNVSMVVVDAATGKPTGQLLDGHVGYTDSEGAFQLFIDVSEDYVASGSENGEGKIWERRYGVRVSDLRHDACVNSVVFAPRSDQEVCVSAADDYKIKVWHSRRRVAEDAAEK